MKRMNGRRRGATARRARGRQYDSRRNSRPSPHCVLFYTFISTLSSIASLSSSLSWKIAGFYCLYHYYHAQTVHYISSANASATLATAFVDFVLLFQILTRSFWFFICLTTRIPTTSSRRLHCIYFLRFFFTDHLNPDFIIFFTTTEHWTCELVRTKTDLLSNQQFGVSTVSLCHGCGLMSSPIFMTFSLNTPCRYAKQVTCKNM